MNQIIFSGKLDSGAIIIEFTDPGGFTGYNSGELLGRNWFEVFIPDAAIVEVLEVFQGLFYGGEPKLDNCNMICCKDGSQKMISFKNKIIKDRRGKSEFVFFTAVEV
ncbi:MAG: PAS domain S-box protein [Pseudomonadota bacterium]